MLIALVLGSILGGLATPTEAAACGAVGSVIMTLVYRTLTMDVMKEALYKTVIITAMILMILVGGTMFAGVFTAAGGLIGMQNLLQAAQLTNWETLAILLLIAFRRRLRARSDFLDADRRADRHADCRRFSVL